MSDKQLPERGFVFWPVGNGDSTTIVIDDRRRIQVDIHDMAQAEGEDSPYASVVDLLIEALPEGKDGRPYLAAFILTHADADHCLGFAALVERVTIGEIWASPRLWREYEDPDAEEELCEDAQAFHDEAERRVAATRKAIKNGGEPASGDRIRIIGYDRDESDRGYEDLPDEYRTAPGNSVSTIDGEDLAGIFEAFIHSPFKDDLAAARNDTSVGLQVSLTSDDGVETKALLLGDLAHATLKKIFDFSDANDRSDKVDWDLLLGPHHSSHRVMYTPDANNELQLQDDILEALDKHASDGAVIVLSSNEFPAQDKRGSGPPHLRARQRYEELVADGSVLSTFEEAEGTDGTPIVFGIGEDGLERLLPEVVKASESLRTEKAAMAGGLIAMGGLAAFALMRAMRRRGQSQQSDQPGLDRVHDAVVSARGTEAKPQQPVAFGNRRSRRRR